MSMSRKCQLIEEQEHELMKSIAAYCDKGSNSNGESSSCSGGGDSDGDNNSGGSCTSTLISSPYKQHSHRRYPINNDNFVEHVDSNEFNDVWIERATSKYSVHDIIHDAVSHNNIIADGLEIQQQLIVQPKQPPLQRPSCV